MVIPEAREISKMSKNHNNALCRGEFGVPTLFDLFSRPLSAFSGFDMENEGFKADVEDKGDRYQVKAEMPGVKKEDIVLDGTPSSLTISVNTDRRRFSKTLALPCDVDIGSAKATYNNGILEVTLNPIRPMEHKTKITVE